MVQLLVIGIGAGLTAALLFATLATGQAFAVILFYLTPLPVLLAAIAWNHLAGAVAAITAAGLLGAFFGGWFFLTFAVGIGLPAYLLGYLALLGRTGPDGSVEWYPAGRLVLAGALIAASATALSIPAFGTDPESYRAGLRDAFERVLRAQSEAPEGEALSLPGVQDADGLLEFLTIVMPPAAAIFSMITSLANLWLAARIAQFSGRLARSWPEFGDLRFPPMAPLLLAAALVGTFLPGILAVVAGLFAATLLMAYAILGFAIVHGASRGASARAVLLTAMWLSVFLIGWPVLAAALLGLADSFFDFRARFGGANNPDRPPPTQ